MEHGEFSNAAVVAERMTCDGARFSLPHLGDDLYFQNKELIYKLLTEAGMTDEEQRIAVKTAVVSGGKGAGRRHIDTWWMNGKAASIVGSQSEYFARAVSEIHMKCFWVERARGSHDAFVDALWNSDMQATMAVFRGKPSTRSRRTSGRKGARIGNPASDNHKVIYKGHNEKTGMEAHLKGRQLQRIKERAKDRLKAVQRSRPMATTWDVVLEESAYHASQTLLKAIRQTGVNITEFYAGCSSISWEKPYGADDVEALDAAQEAWYCTAIGKPRQAGLPLDGE